MPWHQMRQTLTEIPSEKTLFEYCLTFRLRKKLVRIISIKEFGKADTYIVQILFNNTIAKFEIIKLILIYV
ncbi:hypothetical protein Bhyg_03693 [Pseudolycoriella hygida]|uniref:Uncharacterized protein n=1 Tax=Pseudolycoriella hygida TaxID=35572 RepID=A0A9Q0NE64_9DIPT|nr:hypothetical protein Bhyg_03693 [Pseudolycoriella hygida]